MQNPNDGSLIPLKSLDDELRKGKEHWQTYEVGEKVRFRGWWWEIIDITGEGLKLKASHRASLDERFADIGLLERELETLKKRKADSVRGG